jgi:DNA-binding Xre family transcriptional regulator
MKFKKAIKTINRICREYGCEDCPFNNRYECIADNLRATVLNFKTLEIRLNNIEKICKEYLKNNKKG